MNVKLINKDEIKNFYKIWGTFSRQCYNSPEGKEEIIGKHCHKSGHYSGSRAVSFIFEIDGISRAAIAQLNRHSIGVTINERSMRYVDFSNATIKIPHTIENNDKAKEIFENAVRTCTDAYKDIQELLNEDGIKGEKANQDCRYILPLGTETCGTYGFTLEALTNFMHKRLCCFDEETEVLTENGWKYFKDLNKNDRFYSIDENTGNCYLAYADDFYAYDFKGEMVRVKSQSIDQLVTTNHELLISPSYDNKRWIKIDAINHKDYKTILMKKNCNPISGIVDDYISLNDNTFVPLIPFMKFLGMFISDGSATKSGDHYNICISKGDINIINKYKEICESITNHSVRITNDGVAYKIEFHDRDIYDFIKNNNIGNNALEKNIPDIVWKYDSTILQHLYEGFLDGDCKKDDGTLSTISYKLAGDFQRLLLHIGYSGTIQVIDRIGKTSRGYDKLGNPYEITTKNIEYRVGSNKSKNEPIIKTTNRDAFSSEYYDGKVYCVSLEKYHNLYIRRNGRTVWSGNCRSQWEIRELARMMRDEVLEVLPELEDELVPTCEFLLWCPEGKSCCGKAPTKEQLKNKLND